MNNNQRKGLFDFKEPTRVLKTLFVATLTAGLLACGGGGGGGGKVAGGEITGTGFIGRTAVGAAIANADIDIKSQSGASIETTSDGTGEFASSELREVSATTQRGPYLLRVEQNNGEFLYSVAHTENAINIDSDSVEITVNIHPYTDLIIRNWFATQGLDIDSSFTNGAIASLPSVDEINAISDEFLAILVEALGANNAASNTDLLSSPFTIGDNFDQFLDNSSVIINDSNINDIAFNIIINQTGENPVQTILVNNVELDTDFTLDNGTAPTMPERLRALAASDSEVVIVWEESTDDRGVAGYNIYRNGEPIAITPFPVYSDIGLSTDVTYSYTVEAFDGRGQTSALTSPTDITLNTPDTTAPPAATSASAIELDGFPFLSWTQDIVNDVEGFQIYRGAPGFEVTVASSPIATVTSTFFDDFNITPGTTYCYRIVTFDAAGNDSAPTAEACISISGISIESSVSFSAETYSVNEATGTIDIVVNRTGDPSQAISVDYSATAGTATAGNDFTETNGTLNWGATDSSNRMFTIQINSSSEAESDETVNLELSNPSANLVNGIDTAVLTITDAAQLVCTDLSSTTNAIEIDTNTTLSDPCYNVLDNIDVSGGATLTINPGVRLEFAQGTDLDIEADGVLSAIGTATNPIVFTGAVAAAGYWGGLEIQSVAPSELNNVIVEYGGGLSFNEANVGISFDGRLNVSNSTIRHSASVGVGFSGNNSRLVSFTNNVVTLNEDAPISIPENQVGVLASGNLFAGNNTAVGGDRDYIQIISSTGGVTTDQVWNLFDVPYRMHTFNNEIAANLTLAPGITLLFPADAGLIVEGDGTLNAVGTAAQPITFTGLQQTAGFWDGIQFNFNNNNNVMDHTVVEYGGGDGNTLANVGVFGQNGRLTISNSTLSNSSDLGFDFGTGITLSMDNVTITGNNQPGIMNANDAGQLDINSSYSGNTDDRVVLRDLPITTDQVLANIGVPYFLSGSFNFSVDAAWTIAAGTEIQFDSTVRVNVSGTGTLIAQGTTSAPILFTGAQQTPGYWAGIQITFSNNANLIDNAIIEYAGSPGGNTEGLIGFFGQNSNGIVSNTILRSSQTNGIWLDADTTGSFNVGNTFEDIAGENIFIDP